ncbi:Bug family tripartite tricarboxylate transporter substrate binding protein [Pseudochelatococcus sp. B33]
MTTITKRVFLGAMASVPFIGRAVAQEADWPTRPVTLLLPYGPSGAAGIVAQALAVKLTEKIGQPVVVDNRPGGNAVVGANAALAAPADGYTMFWDSANQITNPVTVKDLTINYKTDFVPVTQIARFPSILAVREDFPAGTIAEFLEYVRNNPGKVTCGTHSTFSVPHLALALMQKTANIKLAHIPYKGASDAVRDLMGGQVDAVIATTSTIKPAFDGGKARILAATGAERVKIHPDVPTLAESGFPGFNLDDWAGMFFKSGVPDSIVQKASKALGEACRDPSVAGPQEALGTVLVGGTPEEFLGFITQQRTTIETLIAELGIKHG